MFRRQKRGSKQRVGLRRGLGLAPQWVILGEIVGTSSFNEFVDAESQMRF